MSGGFPMERGYRPEGQRVSGLQRQSSRKPQESDESPRVLLVEDEKLLLKPVVALLREEGFEVLAASDGAEALDIYARDPEAIALVVLDVHLPRIDGYQVFLRMKELDSHVAVIFVSGNASEEARHAILASGAMGYIPKPYRIETLVGKIRESLDRRSKHLH